MKIQAEIANLCMIYEGSRVVVQDRKKMDWPGIAFPGGHVEPGESITESVIREMKEETGLTIQHPILCGIKEWTKDNGTRYILFFYKSGEFSGELKSSEEGEVFWAEIDDLPAMNLANDMELHLRIFLEDGISELYCKKRNGSTQKRLL